MSDNVIFDPATLKFDDVSFFADFFIQLSFNDKLIIENSDKTNDNVTLKIVDTYYNFYKIFSEEISKILKPLEIENRFREMKSPVLHSLSQEVKPRINK